MEIASNSDVLTVRPLRVGVVTTSFPNATNPASGIFLERLVSQLPEEISPIVLCPCAATAAEKRIGHNYEVSCFRYAPRKWMRLTNEPGGIPDAIRRRDPAVLLMPMLVLAMFFSCLRLAGKVSLIHGNWSVPALLAACAARLRGRPAISTLRGEDLTRSERSFLHASIVFACLALNNRTVVVSKSHSDALQRRFPRYAHKIEFVPNGVAMPVIKRPGTFQKPLRLLTVASLISRKRVDVIIRALAELRHTTDAVLRIAGDGPERVSLEALASDLNVTSSVEFLGMIPPDEVAGQIAWADVFILASESEGRPNALLEAMAAGLPSMASDIPGVRELILDEAGILHEVGDWTSLANDLKALSQAPDRGLAMGLAARRRIETDGLTWRATANRYAAIYQDLAGLNRN